MLLTTQDLLDAMKTELARAKQVDIAVAWAKGCDALNFICHFGLKNPGKLRAIIGLDLYGSEPAALRNLHDAGKLRLFRSSGPVYHPKFYLFNQGGKTAVWVGSSNLSRGAFTTNTELMHVYQDDGSAKKWFENLWGTLKEATGKEIDEYEKAKPEKKYSPSPKPKTFPLRNRHPITLISKGKIKTWGDYLKALKTAEPFWERATNSTGTVFGEDFGWSREIDEIGSLFQRQSWKDLSKVEGGMLLGTTKTFGWLGAMKGAGLANKVFKSSDQPSVKERKKIYQILRNVIQSSDSGFAKTAGKALADVCKIDGFSEGVASRLITLARPDRAVSVNGASRNGLAVLSKSPKNQLGKNYEKLLNWVASQPWHNSPQPKDPFEHWVWKKRAALLDVFAYDFA